MIALRGYIGTGGKVQEALVRFAEEYADLTEADYAQFMKGVKSGRIKSVKAE